MISALWRFMLGGLLLIIATQSGMGGEFRDPSGFSFTYPNGWVPITRDKMDDVKQVIPPALKDWIDRNHVDLSRISVMLIRDGHDEFLENLNVVVSDQGFPINDEALKKVPEAVMQQYASMGITVKNLQTRVQRIGPHDALVLEYRHDIPNVETPLWQRQVMMPGGGKLYIITCTAKADRVEEYQPTFDNILASFRVPAVTSKPLFDWNRILTTSITGGIVGGLVGGLSWVVKQFRKPAITTAADSATEEQPPA